ncbi:MAG TPA: RNA 2',3'-cyclic phosphodiesterase [Blastocatellia bacterium]|nr:RNA 2',3'-cyclic phosphodiesterase [Blastocatellia bacterium]
MSRRNERVEPGSRDSIRTFICIEVPQTVKERIESLQRMLRINNAQISWMKPSNIHLTIKFLGDVPLSKTESVRDSVERAAKGSGEFDIEVSTTGCFPSARSPRVLWVGLGNMPDGLKQLHANVESELARAGFPREQKRFSPHLTIGRVRSPQNAARTAEDLIAQGFAPETFRATEIIVMRSELNSSGSIYTPQAIIKLGTGELLTDVTQ